MVKKLITISVLVVFGLSLSLAAEKIDTKKHKIVADEGKGGQSVARSSSQQTQSAAAPVLIGKMWNGYSSQSSYTNLISYDPYAGVVGISKRTDRTGAGSGRITYQASTDDGATWTPQLGPLNPPGFVSSRHPNTLLSNPGKVNNPDNVQFLIAENELISGAFRDVIYMSDSLTGSLVNYAHDSSNVFVYAGAVDYNTGKAYWPIVSGADNNSYISWTSDKGKTYTKKLVVPLSEVHTDDSKMVEVGVDGTVWYVFRGKFFGVDTVDFIYRIQWSTDGGNTWSTAKYFKHSDAGKHGNNYEWDLISDKQGNIHIAVVLVDTVATPGTEKNELYDVIIPKSGAATYKKVANINRNGQVIPNSSGLQALNEPEYARTLDGASLALKWVDTKTAAVADTNNDIFITHTTNNAAWAAPTNITNSPTINEYYSNTATIMKNNGQTFTYYTNWTLTDLDETDLWFVPDAKVTLKVNPVNDILPSKYSLDQNYPNPFNPSTTISYNVPVSGFVEVGVYNMLGQKIATLVNEEHVAGQYTTSWNGKDANGMTAASGIYFYKMRAGQFESVKKMMLMK